MKTTQQRFAQYTKPIGVINANRGQIQIFRSKLDYQEKNVDTARAQANELNLVDGFDAMFCGKSGALLRGP